MTFFTADIHFGHDREFIYKDRGCDSIQEHDERLVHNFNECLKPDDQLYIIGDVSCGRAALEKSIEFLSQLKCKVYVIKGNHDDQLFQQRKKLPYNIHFIDSVYLDINIQGQKISLCHYPMVCWNGSHWNNWLLYGHVHNKQIPLNGKTLDVSPNKDHMYPYLFEEINQIIQNKPNNWDFIDN